MNGKRLNLHFPLWVDGSLGPDLHAGARALRDCLDRGLRYQDVSVDDDCLPAIGGDCGIEVPIVFYLRQRHGPLRVLWFDARGGAVDGLSVVENLATDATAISRLDPIFEAAAGCRVAPYSAHGLHIRTGIECSRSSSA